MGLPGRLADGQVACRQIWGGRGRAKRPLRAASLSRDADTERRPRPTKSRLCRALGGESSRETMLKPPFARLLAVVLAAVLAGCEQPQQAAPPSDPVVTVAPPTRKIVVDQDEYVGRFVAVDSVEIRARVTGYLDQVHFTDGQMVKQGDLLFTIDRRPFQTSLDQAKATLGQARANLAFTEADLARCDQLVSAQTITEQVCGQRTHP